MKQNTKINKPRNQSLSQSYHIFDFALEMYYFETKFKEKVQEVSKILKSLQKVPDSKLPGV